MENEVKKSAGKVWLIPTIVAAVLLIGLVVFMVIMGKGTSALADGTVTLSEAVSPLQDGTAQLSEGVDAYTEGVDQVADGIEMLNENVPTLADGVQQLADGAVALNKGVNVGDKSLAAGMKSLAAGVDTLDKTLQAGLSAEQAAGVQTGVVSTLDKQFADPTSKLYLEGMKALASGSIVDGINDAKADTAKMVYTPSAKNPLPVIVKSGVQDLVVSQVSDMTGGVLNTPVLVSAQWGTDTGLLAGDPASGVTLGAAVITKSNQQYGSTCEVTLTYDQFLTRMTNYLLESTSNNILDGVSAKLAPMVGQSVADNVYNAVVETCKVVAVQVSNQTMATVRQGMVDKGLFEGVKLLNAGVNGKDGLAEGVKKLQAGTAQLNEGVPTLSDGIKQLFEGSQQLKENSQALRDGASQLKDAAPALIDGIGQLVDGAKKVNGFTPIH